MQHEIGSFTTSEGLRLQTRTWLPDSAPKAAVLLVHGINEHSGRYARLAADLLLHNIAVFAYDHRGHGQSEGPRVFVDSFDEYINDLAEVHQWANEQSGAVPLFLLGHSLGGLITSKYVVDYRPDLHALILSSPALQIPSDLSPLKQKAVGIVNRIAPKLIMGKLDIEQISRDKAIQDAYLSDPLTNNKGIRARVASEILRTTDEVRKHPDAFNMPLFLYHGTADKITDPEGSKWLYEAAPSTDKSLELYDRYRHETMNEIGREVVVENIISWIEARI